MTTPTTSSVAGIAQGELSPAATASDREIGVAFGLRPVDFGVMLVALILCVGHAPPLLFPSWTVRYAAILAVLPIGLISLVSLVRRRDGAAMWAGAFLCVALVSALMAGVPHLSLWGWAGADTFWLLYVGVLALWAWGRSLDARSTRLLELTVVAALAINVAWAALQMAFDVQGGAFNVHPGRASGFFSNPAYYATAIAAGFGWAMHRSVTAWSRFTIGLVAFFSFGLALSGSRLAVGVALVGLVGVVVADRSRRAVAVWVASVAGFAIGSAITASVGSRSSVSRLAEDGDGRTEVWKSGLQAFGDRPLFGWGLGRQSVALQSHMSERFVATVAIDDAWSDPHNLVILLLATTGTLGVLAAAGFGVAAVRAVRQRKLLVMVTLMVLNYGLQPATIHTLPLAMMLLGAAGHADVSARPVGRASTGRLAAVGIGLVAAVVSIVPAYTIRQALIRGDGDDMADSAWRYPGDPWVADKIAAAYGDAAKAEPELAGDAVEWAERTVDAEPDRAFWRVSAGLRETQFGEYELARANLDEALELNRWNVGAHEARFLLAVITHDAELERSSQAMLCRLGSTMCAVTAADPTKVAVSAGESEESDGP